ncbi:hypothetical protein ANO14919_093150 [Xylariales sp. No.14919]|nr:hypothetical protein ANO14919_093150 [Xylariales sp. No.14919]
MGRNSPQGGILFLNGDHGRRRSRSYNHTSQSQNSAGLDTQPVRSQGNDDFPIPVGSSRQGIDTPPSSRLGKHRAANDSLTDIDHVESDHSREGKVRPTDTGFEDVDLSGSGKKSST